MTNLAPDKCSVRVAIRIRPEASRKEGNECMSKRTEKLPGLPQVIIGEERAFTFDYVFDQQAKQAEIYEQCVRELVVGTFDGYNATVFAYGQTGSGKTFTMGTSFGQAEESVGIIQRAAADLFGGIEQRKADAASAGKEEPTFEILVHFIELYNEEIIDLLAEGKQVGRIQIREDLIKGEIQMKGVASIPIRSVDDMMCALEKGTTNRRTIATNMNQTSSRSHAIFSVFIKQRRSPNCSKADIEFLTSKLHFVDLAGSERMKRSGVTGDQAKECININSGLLALGNVINALGCASGKCIRHVPYRDSKLTRLLQDSLGGNSRTLMIACVSPCSADYSETLNTLQYANRAKSIKNKVVANQTKKFRQREVLHVQNGAVRRISSRFNKRKRSSIQGKPRVMKPPNAIQPRGMNGAKSILKRHEQVVNRPGYALSVSKNAGSTYQARNVARQPPFGDQTNRRRIMELEADLEKANRQISNLSINNAKLEREIASLKKDMMHCYEVGEGRGRTMRAEENCARGDEEEIQVLSFSQTPSSTLKRPKPGMSSFNTTNLTASQTSNRLRFPLRQAKVRRSRSLGFKPASKPEKGGFYVPCCILPTPKKPNGRL